MPLVRLILNGLAVRHHSSNSKQCKCFFRGTPGCWARFSGSGYGVSSDEPSVGNVVRDGHRSPVVLTASSVGVDIAIHALNAPRHRCSA